MSAADRLSEARSEPRSLRVSANGAELHLLSWGAEDATPVLLVHGMRGHARWFSPVGPALAAAGFRALSVDLRGHGESEHAGPYGVPTYADDLVALREHLGLDDFVLLGHSMGGGVALRAATQIAQHLRALVVVDSNFAAPLPDWQRRLWELRYGVSLRRPNFVRPPRRGERPPPRSYFADRDEGRRRFKLRPGDTVASQELLDHLADHALLELPDGRFTWRFAPELGGPRQMKAMPSTQTIRCPVLLIYGDQSPIVERTEIEKMSRLFPRAACTSLDRVEGAHHHVFLDQPEAFNALLIERLAALQR